MGSELVGFSLLSLGVLLAFMTLVWVVSLPLRNASIVDVVWSLNFLVVAVLGVAVGDGVEARRWLLCALVAIWAVRLSAHIFARNHGRGEDYRYQGFRKKYGAERYWWVSLFQVFWLQGALAWFVSLPLQVVAVGATPAGLTVADVVGVALWAVGFGFEAIGDAQLAAFKRDPSSAGTVMDRGLWRYTRHPNYFGDATLWWGFGAIAVLAPWGWAALVGPVAMTLLLVKVSGVAMLERSIGSRRPGYAAYVRRTSAFFPRPPKVA